MVPHHTICTEVMPGALTRYLSHSFQSAVSQHAEAPACVHTYMGLAPFCQGWPVAAIATGDISNQEVRIAAIDTDFAHQHLTEPG